MFRRVTFTLLCIFTVIVLFTAGCSKIAPTKTMQTSSASNNQTQIATPPPLNQSQSQSNTNQSSPSTGITPHSEAKPTDSAIPVLYYHSISSVPKNELCMSPSEFEKQMDYLSRQGYHTPSLTQLNDFFNGKGTLPEKSIAITFDDGYKDNYTNALPIMKKYGFTGTVFVIVGNVGSKGKLSWEDLKGLIKDGWQIGNHSMTHVDLTKLNSSQLIQEVKKSKQVLEKHLGPIKSFSYPSGRYNTKVEKALKDAGYLMGFTTNKGWASQKTNPLLEQRVYCYSSMDIKEFERRVQNPQY